MSTTSSVPSPHHHASSRRLSGGGGGGCACDQCEQPPKILSSLLYPPPAATTTADPGEGRVAYSHYQGAYHRPAPLPPHRMTSAASASQSHPHPHHHSNHHHPHHHPHHHSLHHGHSGSHAPPAGRAGLVSPGYPPSASASGGGECPPPNSSRQRSGSIGSAGSSLRESRSPSHDSTASQDSYSHGSPLSASPSPPLYSGGGGAESKLFGILKGTLSTPYSSLFVAPSSGGLNSEHTSAPSSVRVRNHTSSQFSHYSQGGSSSNSTSSSASSGSFVNPVSLGYQRSRALPVGYASYPPTSPPSASLGSPRTPQQTAPQPLHHPGGIKRELSPCPQTQEDDAPMDLSCKPKRFRPLEPFLSPLLGVRDTLHPDPPLSPLDASEGGGSILESILSGRAGYSQQHSAVSPSPGATCTRPASRGTPGISMPASPMPASRASTPGSGISSPSSPGSASVSSLPRVAPRCPWRQRVTLAKKNMLPVSARVSDWLLKLVQFAKALPEFASLPHNDKLSLVLNAWARLLLLQMAENNFQFAVTPIHNEEADGGMTPLRDGAIDPNEPTTESVEAVQGFIRKCQTQAWDAKEYFFIRMVTLFHAGCTGLENGDFVEKVNSYVRQSLQDHISAARPTEKLRYSTLLLCLHTLFGINVNMVQNFFCKHISKSADMEVVIKELLQTVQDDGD